MTSLNAIKSFTLMTLIGIALVLQCGPGHDKMTESIDLPQPADTAQEMPDVTAGTPAKPVAGQA